MRIITCSGGIITLHYVKSYLECPKSPRTARTLYEIKGVMWEYSYVGKHLEKKCFQTVTENRQSLCGSNVRWKTVPESTASSGESTIANMFMFSPCVSRCPSRANMDPPAGLASPSPDQHGLARRAGESVTRHLRRHQMTVGGLS